MPRKACRHAAIPSAAIEEREESSLNSISIRTFTHQELWLAVIFAAGIECGFFTLLITAGANRGKVRAIEAPAPTENADCSKTGLRRRAAFETRRQEDAAEIARSLEEEPAHSAL